MWTACTHRVARHLWLVANQRRAVPRSMSFKFMTLSDLYTCTTDRQLPSKYLRMITRSTLIFPRLSNHKYSKLWISHICLWSANNLTSFYTATYGRNVLLLICNIFDFTGVFFVVMGLEEMRKVEEIKSPDRRKVTYIELSAHYTSADFKIWNPKKKFNFFWFHSYPT